MFTVVTVTSGLSSCLLLTLISVLRSEATDGLEGVIIVAKSCVSSVNSGAVQHHNNFAVGETWGWRMSCLGVLDVLACVIIEFMTIMAHLEEP